MRIQPLTRTASSFTAARSYSTTPSIAHLTQKSVLEISGPDAQKFLKGLTSRDVESIRGGYSGFLNASGRVLHAVFILPLKARVPTYYILHETPDDHPAPLLTTLPPFRLRSKVRIRDVTPEWDVWSAWGSDQGNPTPTRTFKLGSGGAAEASWSWSDGYRDLDLAEGELGCWDLRAGFNGMGRQLLVPKGRTPSLASTFDTAKEADYHLRRILLGVPESPREIIPGSALPLESCMDVHGGVDFRKGCYLGQELTVRTYHTGATRKRILPVRIDAGGALPPGLDITYHPPPSSPSQKPRSAGKILTLSGNIGLGLVRIEMAQKSCWGTAQEEAGRLTVCVDGQEYAVDVQKGEAYAASIAS